MNQVGVKKSVLLTVIFSLLPGLSQIYLGDKKKGFFLLLIDAGIIFTLITSKSYLMRILMAGIFLVTFLPSAVESYQIAKYGERKIDTSSRWYVTILLLCTGFTALPLLWSSEKFSKKAKINWTVAVPILAFLFFSFLIKYWDMLENGVKKIING